MSNADIARDFGCNSAGVNDKSLGLLAKISGEGEQETLYFFRAAQGRAPGKTSGQPSFNTVPRKSLPADIKLELGKPITPLLPRIVELEDMRDEDIQEKFNVKELDISGIENNALGTLVKIATNGDLYFQSDAATQIKPLLNVVPKKYVPSTLGLKLGEKISIDSKRELLAHKGLQKQAARLEQVAS